MNKIELLEYLKKQADGYLKICDESVNITSQMDISKTHDASQAYINAILVGFINHISKPQQDIDIELYTKDWTDYED